MSFSCDTQITVMIIIVVTVACCCLIIIFFITHLFFVYQFIIHLFVKLLFISLLMSCSNICAFFYDILNLFTWLFIAHSMFPTCLLFIHLLLT